MTIYRKMLSRIQNGDYLSDIIDASIGLPQGGPNRGKLFSIFLSDLPEELKKLSPNAGVEIFGIIVSCILFMDDVAISKEAVISSLSTLASYRGKWFTTFSRDKRSVLCLNTRDSTPEWNFGGQIIRNCVGCWQRSLDDHLHHCGVAEGCRQRLSSPFPTD